MSRTAVSLWFAGSIALTVAGCAHMVEMKAIEGFTAAVESQKLDDLKGATSPEFGQKALRIDECVDDLKILRLPTDKPEIVSVEDVSETEKTVVVEVGETKKKLRYKLVKDESSRKWVVDDVYIKQKKEGVTATKSVTEQMDLLLSVREFLRAWDSGDRKDILEVTAPSLRSTLDTLPPAWLAHVTRQVVGDTKGQGKVRPEAQLDDDVAVVKVPRKTGQIIMNLELSKGHWQVTDLAVENKGDKGEENQIPSVKKHVIALNTAITFLQAYASVDHETLTKVCTNKFYKGGLAPGDLTSVSLPNADLPSPRHQFRIVAKRAELIMPTETEQVKVSLIREEAADADSAVKYRVEDVSLYDLKGGGEKRLSSMFTAHAMLDLFTDALARRDLPMLRKTSTADFNRRVWERLKQSGPVGTVPLAATGSHTTIEDLPLGEIPSEEPKVLATKYNGAVTEIKVRQGQQELTYLLRESAGEVRIDDVMMPFESHARSLKETTELIVPFREFVAGLELADLGLIQRTSSTDYNRLVWKQTDKVPHSTFSALKLLQLPITSVKSTPEEVTITLGTERLGARVQMVKEYSRNVVDDVFLIRGLEASQRMKLKQTMRMELAGAARLEVRQHDVARSKRPIIDNGVVSANYQEFAEENEEPISEELTPPEPADDAFATPAALPESTSTFAKPMAPTPLPAADEITLESPPEHAEPELETAPPAHHKPAPKSSKRAPRRAPPRLQMR